MTTSNLKMYGFEKVLKPFIEDVKLLAKVGETTSVISFHTLFPFAHVNVSYLLYLSHMMQGTTVCVRGETVPIQGTVLLFLADTLGAHQIGGFKSGIGFALRKCRDCLATTTLINTKVV